jgi:hypothetical protein
MSSSKSYKALQVVELKKTMKEGIAALQVQERSSSLERSARACARIGASCDHAPSTSDRSAALRSALWSQPAGSLLLLACDGCMAGACLQRSKLIVPAGE